MHLFQICSGVRKESGRNADAECLSKWNPEAGAAVCDVRSGK